MIPTILKKTFIVSICKLHESHTYLRIIKSRPGSWEKNYCSRDIAKKVLLSNCDGFIFNVGPTQFWEYDLKSSSQNITGANGTLRMSYVLF